MNIKEIELIKENYKVEIPKLKKIFGAYADQGNDELIHSIVRDSYYLNLENTPEDIETQQSNWAKERQQLLKKTAQINNLINETFGEEKNRNFFFLDFCLTSAWRELKPQHIENVFKEISSIANQDNSGLNDLIIKGVQGNTENGENYFIRTLGEKLSFLPNRNQKVKAIVRVLEVFSIIKTENAVTQKLRDSGQ